MSPTGTSVEKPPRTIAPRFWCHDIYTGSSKENRIVANLFQDVLKTELGETSWNGFEHNVLWMNESATGFRNVAFLLGTAHEQDCRNVVSADLDGDGRRDLVVLAISGKEQSLLILKNALETGNNWIGVRLGEQGSGNSPMGAKVVVITKSGKQVAHVVKRRLLSITTRELHTLRPRKTDCGGQAGSTLAERDGPSDRQCGDQSLPHDF